MTKKHEGEPARCEMCRRLLHLGVDVIGMQAGVIGPRGFVPLEEMSLFCSDACLDQDRAAGRPTQRDSDAIDIARLPRRIP